MKIEKASGNVLVVEMDAPKKGWEQWIMLSGDRHHDNVHSRWDIEEQQLKRAVERDAMIMDFGDLFCAMQGKYDPRSNLDDLRPELKVGDYLDRLVREAEKFYAPYAKNWLLMTKGNHEMNIRKRMGTDLTNSLVDRMRDRHGSPVNTGEYGGWVKFRFKIRKTQGQSVNLKYHHGAGGAAPVTKGVIQTNRQAVYLPDAHIVVNAHTHDGWIVPIVRERFSRSAVVRRDMCYYVRVPTYKDEYAEGARGYHIESWRAPKTLGCVWLRFFLDGDRINYELTMDLSDAPSISDDN